MNVAAVVMAVRVGAYKGLVAGETVGFSINTLDETFRADMDKAVSIERRLTAMKALHEACLLYTSLGDPAHE